MAFDPISFNKANLALNRKFTLIDLDVTATGTAGQILSKDTDGKLIFINNTSGSGTGNVILSADEW